MKNSEYWRRRFEALEDAQTRKGAEYFSQLEKQYQKASAAVQKEVNAWYARFAVNNEISLVEAKKLLNAGELKELKWNVMEYIEKGKTLNISDAWAKELENASSRWHISRLEALQLQMQNQVEMLYGTEHDEISKLMEEIYTEGYYHTAYEIQSGFNIGYDLMKLDTNRISKVLSKPWAADGANFSSRIWKQKTQLVKDLHTELTQAIIRGKNPHQVTQAIAKRFDVSMGQAGRLVSTEAAFFASASNRDCYKELDVEQYEILATLDNRTSDVCQALDGKVFKMSEYEVGVTAPPFHVWCRTTTVPFFDDEFELGAERAARGEDGSTYYVPADMKYSDWKKAFVNGGSKDGLTEISNVATIQGNIDSLKTEREKVNETLTAKQEELDKATAQWLGDVSNDELAKQMEAIQKEIDLLTEKKISLSNEIQELMSQLPKDETARMNMSIVVDGKDLVGEVDYTGGTFVYDIETAMNAQGFDGVPNIVEYDEFKDAMEKTNFYAERTYSATTQETLDDFREQLYNGKWYVDCSDGGSQHGQGMYCAASYNLTDYRSMGGIGSEMAHYKVLYKDKGLDYSYTEGITLQPGAKILELPNGAKAEEYISDRYRFAYMRKYASPSQKQAVEDYISACIDIEENPNISALYDIRDEAAKSIDPALRKGATDSLMYKVDGMKYPKTKNPSTLAVEMGYDAINAVGHGESGSYTVILNRTKVIFNKGGSIYDN